MNLLGSSDLAALRELSQSALPDCGTVTRPAGGALNTSTGVWEPAPPLLVYAGPMRVRSATLNEYASVFGDTEVTERRYIATLPHTAEIVEVGDRITMTEAADPQIRLLDFRVAVIVEQSYHVERRLGLEAIGKP